MTDRRTVPPLLYLDVDGVILPLGAGPGEPTLIIGPWGCRVRLPAGTPARVHRLAEAFTPVWGTYWQEQANRVLALALDLPHWPVLPLDEPGPDHGMDKFQALRAHAGDRPFAWVDDCIPEEAHAWAAERGIPTLLCPIDPCVGLAEEDLPGLLAFAREAAV